MELRCLPGAIPVVTCLGKWWRGSLKWVRIFIGFLRLVEGVEGVDGRRFRARFFPIPAEEKIGRFIWFKRKILH